MTLLLFQEFLAMYYFKTRFLKFEILRTDNKLTC